MAKLGQNVRFILCKYCKNIHIVSSVLYSN